MIHSFHFRNNIYKTYKLFADLVVVVFTKKDKDTEANTTVQQARKTQPFCECFSVSERLIHAYLVISVYGELW